MELIEAAQALSGGSEFLFPTRSKISGLTTAGIEAGWVRARPKLGLVGINIHDLRRTAAERMKRMGHRSIVPLVLGYAARGVTDIHYDTDDVWAYESDKRVALDA